MRLWTEEKTGQSSSFWGRNFARWLQSQPVLNAKVNVEPGVRLLPFPQLSAVHLEFRIDTFLPNVLCVKAVHGSRVVAANPTPPDADGHFILTHTHDLAGGNLQPPLALSTADCLSLAFVGHSAQTPGALVAGLVHAGWRGFSQGIHWNAMEQWKALGFDPGGISVFIAPAIFGKNYECGNDVRDALRNHWQQRVSLRTGGLPRNWRDAWHESAYQTFSSMSHAHPYDSANPTAQTVTQRGNKIFPDLQCLAVLECVALGIPLNQVTLFRCNTFQHPVWPSYREAQLPAKTQKGARLVTHLLLG